MKTDRYLFLLTITIIIFSFLFTACGSPSEPEPIASYPKNHPIAQYPIQVLVIFRAYLEISVSNVDKAADRAVSLCYDNGGFLSNSTSWFVDGRKVTSLELGVPSTNFERLRRSLLELGDLINESVSVERIEPSYKDARMQYSFITIQLRPDSSWHPPFIFGRWDPMLTLQDAFSVFITIFGFLANIIIWVVVVAGPFALLALLIRWLILRLRRSP